MSQPAAKTRESSGASQAGVAAALGVDATKLPAFPPHLRLELFSQPRYLSGARDMISAVAKRLGFDDTACGQLALAVDEALCNVIRHGYGRRPDGRIWISIWPLSESEGKPGGIRIVIDDLAAQVDPETIRGRDLDDIRPGGLGVYIIRQVMDAVRYERRDEGGMRLHMVKVLGATDADGGH
jgi:anti-sigma regulatory factor (Ser/Thr protein kinase)